VAVELVALEQPLLLQTDMLERKILVVVVVETQPQEGQILDMAVRE
jgi:hypothetical protein